MADTVKKSRIVSGDECLATFDDEDTSLQDIINQEFNQRLKTCMRDSEENNDSFIEPNAEHIELTYSPNEQNIVLKNGNSDLKKTLSSTPQLSLDLKTKTSDILQEDTSTVLTKKITEEREDSKEDIEEKTVKNGVVENGKIDKEETTHSEETKSHLNDSNGLNHTSDSQHSTEDIPSENLPKEQQKSPEKTPSEPLAIEVNKPQDISPEDSFVNKEIPSPEDDIESPFDNVTVTDVDDENLTAKERFLSTVKDLEDDKITIKDRMFLNTESGCLLFTQTVVQSPMLTPTEESYDFLQGIKNSSETNQTSPIKNEEIVPILETLSTNTIEDTCQNNPALNLEPDISEISEISAENEVCNRLESSNSEQDISESLKSEEIPENRENIKDLTLQFLQNEIDSEINSKINELKTPTIVEYLVEDIEPNDGDFVENYAEITPDTTKFENSLTEEIKTEITDIDSPEKNNENINIIVEETPEKLLDTPDEIPEELPTEEENIPLEEAKISPTKVSEISKIFTSKDSIGKEEIKSPILEETFEDIKKTKEIFERKSEELKSCDLVKKISGPTSPGSSPDECDNTNIECPNISTTMTSESSFVETRTETNSSQDKVLKKKKSKKSKKDNEKENISVCDYTNTNDDDQLSHVSVKNLCRSFSDLTSIGIKNGGIKLKQKIAYGRTKSCSDIRRDDANLENVFGNVSVKSLKSSFSKFDALQKKTVLHVRSSDSGKAQEKFNGTAQIDASSCKSCGKQVFQMEQIKAEKAIWHKNCFRCKECNKQLNVDTYQSNEGVLYCKPHFKALFTPKAVEDEPQPIRPRKHELIIRENQPQELPPDVVRASDKPDLGLEELQNLNVKERFQVFEQHESQDNNLEKSASTVNVKRSPSILSKLAKFQSKGMDIGVADDSLNGVPVEESSSEEDEEEDGQIDGEDAELVRARRAQREKPIHFTNMSDVMSKWESGNQMTKEERREERKQEIQSIRSRLFMGKQAKIKEMYQQAVADSSTHVRKQVPLDAELGESARSLRERFERGEKLTSAEEQTLTELDDASVFESGISKKSRSIFLELDANASKPPILQQQPVAGKGAEVRRARETFMARQASEDVVRSSDQVDDVEVKTADISSRFKFFETYKEPEKQRKEFRITPPRDGTVKLPETPIQDSTPVPSEDDTNVASESHTASRMLSVFRQMEESAGREPVNTGPKPLKRFTPPPEPQRQESESEGEYSEEEDEEEVEEVEERRVVDEDLIEAQKAARAKQLRAKFEKWEANEIKREQNNSSVNIAEEMADADSQIESARSLRARFESMREVSSDKERTPKVKVNRFVDTTNNVEICKSCEGRVYPLEKVSCHNNVYHKNCFRCRECNTVLRMDSYTYNQGLLYCLPHFKRLFISKGNYEAGFGLGQHKEKWNTVA